MSQNKKTVTAYARVLPDCPECSVKMLLERRRGAYTVHCGNPGCQNYRKVFLQPFARVEMTPLESEETK